MKAQSWRKFLGFANGALILGIVAAGTLWFMNRSASADAAKPPKWTSTAFAQYQLEAKGAHSQPIWPVNAEMIKQITRPDDLMNPIEKGGPYVWPYVGPVPPPKKAVAVEGPKVVVAAPTGLEVLGKPQIVYSDGLPEGTVVVTWLFKEPAGKSGVTFVRGDPFITTEEREKREKLRKEMKEAGKPEAEIAAMLKKGRFKLKDGWQVPGSYGADRRVVIVYDVYDEEKDTVIASNQMKDFILGTDAPKVEIDQTPATVAASGAARSSRPSLPDGVAPALAEVKVVVHETSPSSRVIEADENVYRYMKFSDPDKLLADVKTEDAKDASGKSVGVKMTGVTPGSFASQFDVKPGDILKSINGTPVHSRAAAVEVVKKIPKDTTNVQVVIERNGRQITYDVDPRDPKIRGAGGKFKFDNKK